MPKLSKVQTKGLDAPSSFEPLDDGVYHGRLREVTAAVGKDSGKSYWKWEFEVVEEPYINRRLWKNTPTEGAGSSMTSEIFEAFGASPDTDTDELCGEVIKLVVSTKTIQSGSRKGELGNEITRTAPAADDFELPDEAQTSGAVKGADGEDLF